MRTRGAWSKLHTQEEVRELTFIWWVQAVSGSARTHELDNLTARALDDARGRGRGGSGEEMSQHVTLTMTVWCGAPTRSAAAPRVGIVYVRIRSRPRVAVNRAGIHADAIFDY